MKNLVLLCIPFILAGLVRGSMNDAICGLTPGVVGPCRARKPRYSYDPSLNSCKLFYYGGCKGNENNFMTKELCEEKCNENIA